VRLSKYLCSYLQWVAIKVLQAFFVTPCIFSLLIIPCQVQHLYCSRAALWHASVLEQVGTTIRIHESNELKPQQMS